MEHEVTLSLIKILSKPSMSREIDLILLLNKEVVI